VASLDFPPGEKSRQHCMIEVFAQRCCMWAMTFVGDEPPELRIEEFFKATKPDWTDFYVLCSGRVFSLNEHDSLIEIPSLPEHAERIPFVARRDEDSWCYPTPIFRDRVIFVGGGFGGDVNLLLANGGVVSSFLDWIPHLEVSRRILAFFEASDLVRLEVAHSPDELTPFPIELL
jgi:hypothetical protein